jgi:hypothetical protein
MELLRDALSGTSDGPEDLWALLSCKAAVKAGAPLAQDEALALLDAWLAAEDRDYCPHGRPVRCASRPRTWKSSSSGGARAAAPRHAVRQVNRRHATLPARCAAHRRRSATRAQA